MQETNNPVASLPIVDIPIGPNTTRRPKRWADAVDEEEADFIERGNLNKNL